MSVKLSNANLHRDGDSGGNSNDLRTHIGKRRAATAARAMSGEVTYKCQRWGQILDSSCDSSATLF